MAIHTLVVFGDSLAKGSAGGFDFAGGGTGSWVEQVQERLANLQTLGPVISSGCRAVYTAQWAQVGTWTRALPSDAFQKCPYNQSYYANGVSNTTTFTLPPQWGRPVVGFALYWTDYPGGGNWQYRVDGGTWTNMGQTLVHDNSLNKFYVPTPVASTVDIRGYDGTADCGTLPVGLEVFYTDPHAVDIQGIIVHNYGAGGNILQNLAFAQTGDGMAVLDNIKLGTGSPTSSSPTLGTLMLHINDTVLSNLSNWVISLTNLYNRASPLGPVGFISPWECGSGGATQTNFRAQTKTTAAGFSPAAYVLDFYDEWAERGWTGGPAQLSAGLTLEGTHPTQYGYDLIGERVLGWLRHTVFAANTVGDETGAFTYGSSTIGGTDRLAGIPGATIIVVPSAVNAVATVPAMTFVGSVAAATVTAVGAVYSPTILASATVLTSVAAGISAIPPPTIVLTATVDASPVVSTVSVPDPTISTSAVVLPDVVAAVATVPIQVVTAAGSVTVAANTVAAIATVPVPSPIRTATATPALVVATVTVPDPAVVVAAFVVPATITAVAAVPAPAFVAFTTVSPAVVAAVGAVPGGLPHSPQLRQPLFAVPTNPGVTTATPLNDGHTSAEKRTS